ncbi:hypothetical protein EJB05_32908, partial [Eragrostis curvula]
MVTVVHGHVLEGRAHGLTTDSPSVGIVWRTSVRERGNQPGFMVSCERLPCVTPRECAYVVYLGWDSTPAGPPLAPNGLVLPPMGCTQAKYIETRAQVGVLPPPFREVDQWAITWPSLQFCRHHMRTDHVAAIKRKSGGFRGKTVANRQRGRPAGLEWQALHSTAFLAPL